MAIETTTQLAMNLSPRSVGVRQAEQSAPVTKIKPEDDANGVKEPKDSAGGLLDNKRLEKFVDEVNQRFQQQQRSLQFSVQESTGKMVVSVYDATTDKLIRQIPSEEVLAMAEHLQEMSESSVGIVLQDQA